MEKKGQGLPLNVIVIAIIVLVVLVVLIAIFTNRIVIFDQGVDRQGKVGLADLKASCNVLTDGKPVTGSCEQSCGTDQKNLGNNWEGTSPSFWCRPGLVCCGKP